MTAGPNILSREEYIEQAYLFRALHDRLNPGEPMQDLLLYVREEILSTTKLPMAIDFVRAELNHAGTMATAMQRMPHYFSPFQTFLVNAAEDEQGRFDLRVALQILEHEARFRADGASCVPLFFYQFETLCRNRLRYDHGLAAMARDAVYSPDWQQWIMNVRHRIGIVDLADMVYVHSQHYVQVQQRSGDSQAPLPQPLLFGEKEGRIALANRRKEPLYFFAALQRQLGYPQVPRTQRRDPSEDLLGKLVKTVERLETRIKLLEEEQREKGIDLTKFMKENLPPGPEAEP